MIGQWSVDGDVVVLEPVGDGEHRWREGVCPSTCFAWFNDVGATAVEEVRLVEDDGRWIVTFYDLIQDEEVTQEWEKGGLCLTCGEGTEPCDDPFAG